MPLKYVEWLLGVTSRYSKIFWNVRYVVVSDQAAFRTETQKTDVQGSAPGKGGFR